MTSFVTIRSDTIHTRLEAPFDPAFPAAARRIEGRWDASGRAWLFDVRDEQRVRELARQVWGSDGSAADGPSVTVRIDGVATDYRQEYRVAGRTLVSRPGRDAPVRLTEGVIVVAGGWPASGGSVRNPSLGLAAPGTVLEVRDLPVDVARRICAEVPGASIVDSAAAQRAALDAEREQLLARLVDLDAALAAL